MEQFEVRQRGDTFTVSGIPGWAGYRFARIRLAEVEGRVEVAEYALEQTDPAARLPRQAPPLELIETALGVNRERPATVEQFEADGRRQLDALQGQVDSLHRLALQAPIRPPRQGDRRDFYRQVLDVAAIARMKGDREREALASFYGFGLDRAKQVAQEARRALQEPYRGPGARITAPTTSTPIPWADIVQTRHSKFSSEHYPDQTIEVPDGHHLPPPQHLDPAEQDRIRRERRVDPPNPKESA